ncbi:MAG: helix-turn-helix domain-containing protein [Thermomicrobiales bacterium]
MLSKRLRHFSELIEDLSLRPVLGRVARLLLLENDEYLTQSQMASMIGSSREVVNRSLHRLEHDGIITINHHHVTVRDAAKLWRIVDDVKPARD